MIRMPEDNLQKQKERLIKRLKRGGYLETESVERAFREVPRSQFLRPGHEDAAYRDTPQPISHGQTISAPHMCVIMCEKLKLGEGLKVLEVGAGSGYHAALCAELVASEGAKNPGHVYTVEIVEHLIEFAESNLKRAGYMDRITLIHGDGAKGLPDKAPFDRILVTAAAPSIPDPLIEQLDKGGKMLIPVGGKGFFQELIKVKKEQDGDISKEKWGGVAFVPLTGEFGV
jgi:protein-L-isoaspartate(D-aspartate) O-methyltransferase